MGLRGAGMEPVSDSRYERDTSVSALFSDSFVVRGAAFRLLVVVGFTYSPVNLLLFLTGRGIVVSSRRVDGCGSSSSD